MPQSRLQGKLETCRTIRKQLMIQSRQLKENSPPLYSTDEHRDFNKLNASSAHKNKIFKCNAAPDKSETALTALDNIRNTEPKNEHKDILSLTGKFTPSSDSTHQREVTPVNSNRKKSVGNFPTPRYLVSTLQLSPEASSSEISSTTTSVILNKKNTRLNQNHFGKKCGRTSIKCARSVSPFHSSTSSESGAKHQIKSKSSSQKWNSHDCSIISDLDSYHKSRSNNSITPLKRKQVSFSYSRRNNIRLSEHDCRILDSMAYKKDMQKSQDEFAHFAHQLWTKDREEREQQTSEQLARWRELVSEKRRLESIENSRKMEEMKQSLRQSQQQLEHRIHQKEKRASILCRAAMQRKMSEVEERSLYSAKRRSEVEAAHQQREMEAAMWQQALEEQQKLKLERAESTRMQHQETYRRRVASANRVEELRHQERWQQVQDETKAALEELRRVCQEREQRAQEKHRQMVEGRNKQLKGQSLERSIRFQQVHQLQDELDTGLKKWQDQVVSLQWQATEQAGAKATRHLESKRQKVETENRARWLHHTHLMNRISRQDEARICNIREIIRQKEAKMERMAQERDVTIRESRLNAQTTADLREHIRRTLSPETFDRKVARVALEMRVTGRPPTASPPMTRSNIFLG
ncbi:trichoplein keratin filament-binding protein-like isoform X2 [Periplaneta americana]|uniref:trichoplein keratin filament-binding protein-like isoform X2 n=1 Tax=Periplaneta americana TaxID=6978 RepID=UPI0037E74CCE